MLLWGKGAGVTETGHMTQKEHGGVSSGSDARGGEHCACVSELCLQSPLFHGTPCWKNLAATCCELLQSDQQGAATAQPPLIFAASSCQQWSVNQQLHLDMI